MILQSVEQCRVFQALHGDTVSPFLPGQYVGSMFTENDSHEL